MRGLAAIVPLGVEDALCVIDVLSNGNLLYSVVESRKDYENGNIIPLEEVAGMEDIGDDPPSFESLPEEEKSRITRTAAGYLFSKKHIDEAIITVDRLLDSSDPAKHAADRGGFDAGKWGKIQRDVASIKSYLGRKSHGATRG